MPEGGGKENLPELSQQESPGRGPQMDMLRRMEAAAGIGLPVGSEPLSGQALQKAPAAVQDIAPGGLEIPSIPGVGHLAGTVRKV